MNLNQPTIYRIRVQGRLDPGWSASFGELAFSVERDPSGAATTAMQGLLADQAALFGLLLQIRDLGLPLVSVEIVK